MLTQRVSRPNAVPQSTGPWLMGGDGKSVTVLTGNRLCRYEKNDNGLIQHVACCSGGTCRPCATCGLSFPEAHAAGQLARKYFAGLRNRAEQMWHDGFRCPTCGCQLTPGTSVCPGCDNPIS